MLIKRLTNTLFIALPLIFAITSMPANAAKQIFNAPHNVKIMVKNINPVNQETDLQIITLFKHNPDTNKYIDGLNDFNEELGGLISNLRETGEFIGDLGETLLFTPSSKSIVPKRVMLIGLGDEGSLTVDNFKIAARIAAREAVRLQAKNITFAPTLQDQGNTSIDLGDVDAAVAEEIMLTYDTEKRLQSQQLTPEFDIAEWTIEAGAGNFDNAATKVGKVVKAATLLFKERNNVATAP